MKRFLASLLALLLLLPILACPATAETITIDTETATYEEIVAAYELLKAARIAHLKATFAENHEVQPLEGITFRSVPWGSTRAEAEAILGPASGSRTFVYSGFVTIYTDGRGLSTYYNDESVAGYAVPQITLDYVYPVLDGKILRDDSLAVICSGRYVIEDVGDMHAVMDDLTAKLSTLYGSYTQSIHGRLWTDIKGNTITLQGGDTSVYLLYYPSYRDALLEAAAQAIAAERAEQEELLRIQNQNNTDGL